MIITNYTIYKALTRPYNGAYTYFNNEKIIIFKSNIKKILCTPGHLVKIKNNNLLVICADYGLYIEDYKFKIPIKLLNGMHLNKMR